MLQKASFEFLTQKKEESMSSRECSTSDLKLARLGGARDSWRGKGRSTLKILRAGIKETYFFPRITWLVGVGKDLFVISDTSRTDEIECNLVNDITRALL